MPHIGISITSSYAVHDVREGASQMIARARAANRAGLDSLFVGDHHAVANPYYQNTPMLGRLLGEWDARPAGALFLLPLWDPVLVAEQVATLAAIAQGPFILQCGIGAGRQQFAAMGASLGTRPSAFEESLTMLRALWAGETVSGSRRFSNLDARISPLPPEPVSVWIGASAPAAIERAARMGDAWLAAPSLPPDDAAEAAKMYAEAADRYGKSAHATIRRDVYVANDSTEARSVRDVISAQGYRGFDPAALMIGEAGSIADEMQQLEDMGYADVIIRNLHPDADKAVASTERMALVKDHLRT